MACTSYRLISVATCLIALLLAVPVIGQSEEDVLRFSFMQPGGTARSNAAGGAFGAVGADPGSIGLNPAGFGLYTTTEISFTPGFEVNDATSSYYGNSATNSVNRAFVNNFGLVLSMPSEKRSNWRYSTFGLIYDRTASHFWNSTAVGQQIPTTLLQNFVVEANGTAPGELYNAFPFTSGLAWDTYGIDPLDTLANTYMAPIPFGSPVNQKHTVNSEGPNKHTSFFYAANYADKLFIGASLGIVGMRYERVTVHTETTEDPTLPLATFSYREDLVSQGSGVDLKVGVIGHATEALRLGISYHSPMWMNMEDDYRTRMTSSFRDGSTFEQTSPDGLFAYRMKTPYKLLGSAAYIIGVRGLVSVDLEWTDYRKAKLNRAENAFDGYDFSLENATIKGVAANTLSIRAGTEWRMGNWYYRGGVGVYPSPYVDTDPRSGNDMVRYTAGIGYRTDHLSIDLGLGYAERYGGNYPYSPELVNIIQETGSSYSSLLTLAYRP